MAAKKQNLQCFLLILQFTLSRSLNIISANNTFKEGDLLISEGNRFALGFFSPGKSSHRYLGIWFHEVKEPHAVWVANRNHPISGFSGVLSINQYGNLVLYDGLDQKVPLWSTNVTGKVADSCVAQLLDSGNLVLLEEKSKRILWQSFDYPTDTLLHGMRLGLNTKTGLEWVLTSWRSKDDPATGDYSVRIDPWSTPQIFLYKGSIPIWRTFLWPWKIFANIYDYKYVNNAEETYFVHPIKDASAILRVIVDNSGLIKWLRWHENDGQWKEFWYVPKYPCDFYAHCGAYGKCSHSIPDVYECSCLPGYKPRFPRDWDLRDSSGGCVRKQAEPSLLCGHGEGFVKVGHVRFPDTSTAARVRSNVSHVECGQECLRNCSCNAYASINNGGRGSECLTWYGELTDTLDYVDEDYEMYVRVDATELAADDSKSHVFHNKKLHILIPSVTLAWTTISLLAYLWIRRRKGVTKNRRRTRLFDPAHGSIFHKNTLTAAELRQNNHPPDTEFFDLRIIVDATNNFSTSNILGQGGFGSVYKGQLPDGQEVAVKRLSKNSGQGIEEFKNEVLLIAKLQHRNLVKLLGYCIEGGERILIYEYLPNKSLDSFLFDQTRRTQMDWTKRLKIIIEIARGILYLHHDSRLRIIHRDLKCGNILLDEEMHPKIADFGTARIFAANQIQEKTSRVIGTYGYMSPEYALFGKFSMKSDVFSYGIILLEIISGRKSNEYYEQGSSLSLIGHVWELWRQNKVMEIVDSSMEESYCRDEALRCIQIGLLCVQENAEDRPSMLEVVLMLASEKSLPYPNQPAFIFRKPANISSSAAAEDGHASSSVNELTITDLLTR